MGITFSDYKGSLIAEASMDTKIENADQAFDLMATAYFEGADLVLLAKETLPAAFFDLSSGMAGEVLQKYANYELKLAIIGDFTTGSQNFAAFIYESNRGKQLAFTKTRQAALDKLV